MVESKRRCPPPMFVRASFTTIICKKSKRPEFSARPGQQSVSSAPIEFILFMHFPSVLLSLIWWTWHWMCKCLKLAHTWPPVQICSFRWREWGLPQCLLYDLWGSGPRNIPLFWQVLFKITIKIYYLHFLVSWCCFRICYPNSVPVHFVRFIQNPRLGLMKFSVYANFKIVCANLLTVLIFSKLIFGLLLCVIPPSFPAFLISKGSLAGPSDSQYQWRGHQTLSAVWESLVCYLSGSKFWV